MDYSYRPVKIAFYPFYVLLGGNYNLWKHKYVFCGEKQHCESVRLRMGRECDWNCQSWHRHSLLGTSPQLGVNSDSVQVQLYCFWPKAFCRNNFVTCCQGSFCPQLRQKNKEQKWEFLYLIPISPKHPGMTAGVAYLAGMGWGKAVSSLTCARLPLLRPPPAILIFMFFKQTKLISTTGPLHCFFLCLESISPTTDFSAHFHSQLKYHLLLETSPILLPIL